MSISVLRLTTKIAASSDTVSPLPSTIAHRLGEHRLPAGQALVLPARSGTTYVLVDEQSGRVIEGQRLVRAGRHLKVQVHGQDVIELQDFFTVAEDNPDRTGPEYVLDSRDECHQVVVHSELAQAEFRQPDAVIWVQGEQAATCVIGAAGVFGALGLLAPIGGGLALAGAVAAAGSSSAQAESAPSPTVSPASATVLNHVRGLIVAGPVIEGHGLQVHLYKADGSLLKADVAVDAKGEFSVDVGDYNGVVIARVTDADTGADYLDEAVLQNKDLTARLQAAGVLAGENVTLYLNINPLTSIAAARLGDTPDAATVAAINTGVAQAFGLQDLHGASIVTTNSGAYNPADGLSEGEKYGAVLGGLAGLDRINGGNTQTTIDGVSGQIDTSGGAVVLSEHGKAEVVAGSMLVRDINEPVVQAAYPSQVADLINYRQSMASGGAGDVSARIRLQAAGLPPDPALTATDLGAIGITGVTEGNLAAVLAAITATPDDGSGVDTVSELQALVPAGQNAYITGGLTPTAASDTGTSPTDNLTKNATPALSGTAGAGGTVSVVVGPQTLTGTVDATGHWSVAVPASLADATYTPQITVTSPAGETAGPVPGTPFTVDTVISPAATGGLSADVANDTGTSPADGLTRNATPTLTGAAEPGATVSVVVGGQTVTAPVDAAGHWSVALPGGLPDGTYTPMIGVTDPAGNTAVPVAGTPFTVDTVVSPAATGGLSADAANDTGTSPTDGLTRNTTPTLAGAAEPGATVSVVVGGQTLTAPVDATGHWSVAVPTGLADGTYTPQISVTDQAGNTAAPVSGTPFTIDTVVSPAAAGGLLADAANDTGTNPADNLTKNATPTLAGTGEPGATVSVAVGGQTFTAPVDAAGHWSVAVPTVLADGTYTPQISVTDKAGNTAAPVAGIPFTIDTVVSPTAAGGLLADAANDTGTNPADNLTKNATPTLAGTGEPGATVSVAVGGQTLTAPVDAAGHWSVAVPTGLADGAYTPQISVTDAAGNTAAPVSGTPFIIDTVVSPAAAGGLLANAANDTGTSAGDNLTKNTTPTLTGTGEAGATVSVAVGDQTLTGTIDATGHWSVAVPTGLADGLHTPQISVTDQAGNVAAPVAGTPFTIDTVVTPAAAGGLLADAVNDTGASPTDRLTKNTTPTVAGTGEPGAAVSVVVGGQTLTGTVDATGHWSVDVPTALADGTYTPQITVTDTAGNVAAAVAGTPFTVDTAVNPAAAGGLSADVVNDTGISATDGLTKNTTPMLTGTAEPGAMVSVTVGGQTLTGTVDATGHWSVSVPVALADGMQTPQISVTDQAGNVAAPIAGALFVVDSGISPAATGGLVADAVNDTGSSASDAITRNTTPTLTGAGEIGAQVSVVVGGQTMTATIDATGHWSVAVPTGLADGTYTPQISVTDQAGNTAAAVAGTPFTVDTVVSPAAAGALKADATNDTGSSASDSITKNTTPTLTGTSEPGATVSVVVGGQTLTATVDATGQWSVAVPTALADNTYTPQISVTDKAGNTAAAVAGTPFTVDTVVSPVTAGALKTDAANDTGTSVSDNLTKNTTPTLTGTGEAGGTVSVAVGGQTVTGTVDATGQWSVAVPTALADSTYTPQITVTDKAGNVAAPVAGTPFTIDTVVSPVATGALTADAVNDTGTSASDSLTKNTVPTLVGTGEAGGTVSVVVGGQTLTGTVDATGHWSVAVPTALADNTYTPQITVTDKAGNVSAPVAGTPFTIDTVVSPAATGALTADAVNDTGSTTSDGITKNTKPTLTGAAEAGSAVSVVVGGQTLTVTADATGQWSVAVPTALADNTYTPQVTVTDKAGNVAAPVAGTPFTVDTVVSPAAAGALKADVANDTGTSASDNLTKNTTPTLTGTGEAGGTVSVAVGGQTVTGTVDATGHWSVAVPTALADNTYTPQIMVTDKAGNVAAPVAGTPFTIDTVVSPTAAGALKADAVNDTGTSTSDGITRNAAPVLTGTAEAGATVSVAVGGLTMTGVTDATGHWTVTVPSSLTDGTYTPQITVTDLAGNVAAPVAATPFKVDTLISPAAAGALKADATNDTGSSASDGVTKNTTPTLTGTSEPGATVSVVVGSQTLTATVDAAGHWSVAVPTALADSTYTPQISVTDQAGNSAAAVAGTPFTVDTVVSPGAAGALKSDATNDTGTSASDNLTKNTTPTLTGTGEAGGTVSVAVGGQTVTGTVDATGNWSVAVPTVLTDNTYTPQITVTDKAGNVAAPVAGTPFTIDTVVSPTAAGALKADAVNDTGTSTSDGITKNPAPVLTGTAETGATVSVAVGGLTVTGAVDATGHWSVTVPGNLTDGGYTPQITVTDAAGNVAAPVAGTPFTVDTLVSPGATGALKADAVNDTGSSASDGITKNTTPTLTGTTEAGATVSVVVAGQTLTTTADAAGSWSVAVAAALADSTYTPQISVTDKAGNTAAAVAGTPFTVDTLVSPVAAGALKADALNDTGSSAGDGITKNTTPILTGTAEAGGTLSVVVGAQTLTGTVDATGHWSVAVPAALVDGTYTPQITVTDKAGNVSTPAAGTPFTVDTVISPVATGGLTADAVNDTGTSVGDHITNNTLPALDGQAEAGSAVSVAVGGQTMTTTADAAGHWSVAVAAVLADGNYSPGITVTDKAGNTSTVAGTGFKVDTQAPNPPIGLSVLDNVTPYNDPVMIDGTRTDDATPTISGLPGSIESSAVISVYDNGLLLGTAMSAADGTWSYTPGTALAAGTHSITVTATDIAGNEGGSSDPFTLIEDFTSIVGGNLADTVAGTAGNDTIYGQGGNDSITAGNGADMVFESSLSGSGADTIDLGAGADAIAAGDEAVVADDTYIGGLGTDQLRYNNGGQPVTLHVTANNALGGVDGTATGTGIGTDTFTSFEDLRGGSGADGITVDATVTNGVLVYGYGGSDTILGGGGGDTVMESGTSGSGADSVDLGAGSDLITAGDEGVIGNDTYIGGAGIDQVSYNGGLLAVNIALTTNNAGGGADGTATGTGIGTDTLTGFESVYAGYGADTITTSAGVTSNLTLGGMMGNDTVRTGSGNDQVNEYSIYGSGTDSVDLGTGNDTLVAGAETVVGNDVYNGGAGTDMLNYSSAVQAVVINATTDNAVDGVNGTATGTDMGTDTFTSFEALKGGAGADTISVNAAVLHGLTLAGHAGNDTVTGGSGDDLTYENLEAGSGVDVVDLGAGNDTIWAGDEAVVGNDTYIGGTGTDVLSYQGTEQAVSISILSDNAAGGVDGTATGTSVGVDAFTGFELFYTATMGASSIVASASVMHGLWISGQGGSDTLTGGSGNDTLIGAAGNDVLTGGAGADTFSFTALSSTASDGGLGLDSLLDFSGATDTLDLATLALAAVNSGNLSQFVQMSGNQLQVDRDGTGTGHAWTTMATFDGSSTVPTGVDLATMYGNGHLVI